MSLLAAYYAAQDQELASRTAAEGSDARNRTMAQQSLSGLQAAQTGLTNAQRDATNTGAAKTAAEASQIGPNGAAARSLDQANTAGVNLRNGLIPAQGAADIAAKNAGTNLTNTQNRDLTSNLRPSALLPSALPSLGGYVGPVGVPLSSTGAGDDNLQGDETGGKILAKGEVAQGKAKKPGPTDTVPAMLTPGEAVLNKGAVSHYGSDVIDRMNKMGLLRMGAESEVAKAHGMPDPHAAPAKGSDAKGKGGKGGGGGKAPAQGFAKGTAKVQHPPALSATTPTPQAMNLPPLSQHLAMLQQMMGQQPQQ